MDSGVRREWRLCEDDGGLGEKVHIYLWTEV